MIDSLNSKNHAHPTGTHKEKSQSVTILAHSWNWQIRGAIHQPCHHDQNLMQIPHPNPREKYKTLIDATPSELINLPTDSAKSTAECEDTFLQRGGGVELCSACIYNTELTGL